MTKLPRFSEDQKVTGNDLNFILSILDSGRVSNRHSATNTGVTGDSLIPTTTNIAGSIDPPIGGVGSPSTVKGFTASYGIDNFSQSHTAYVILSWTPNPVTDFIATYDIYYHKGSDPTLYSLSVGGDVNSARVNNLFPANIYSFSIQAHDAANRISNWAPELAINISADSDPPAVPTGLTATSTSTGVYLNWTEVGAEGISNDLKQYQIAVSLDGGATYPLIKTTGPGNSFFYTPATASQGTVFFKLATVDWTGNMSAYTAPVSAAVGTILGPLTVSGDETITAGKLIFGAATSKIVPGAINVSLRNNADSADNLLLSDAGLGTMRNALSIPPSAGGTVASTSYGSVPVKIDKKSGNVSNYDFTSIPAGFSALRLIYCLRDGSGAGTSFANLQMQFNGDTAGNYDNEGQDFFGTTTTVPSEGLAATTGIGGEVIQNSAGGSLYAVGEIVIPAYAQTFNHKQWIGMGSSAYNTTTGTIRTTYKGGRWRSATAINRWLIQSSSAVSFDSNSYAELWGMP